MFLGKLFVSAATGIIGYCLIVYIPSINNNVYSPVLPTTVIILFNYKVMLLEGWVVGVIFMGVYGMAQDTFLHCFIVDEDTNGKTAKFAPEELKSFFKEERDSS